jgi:hypothetical protein
MDHVHDTPVEQLMRKRPVILWHAAAPVGAPVWIDTTTISPERFDAAMRPVTELRVLSEKSEMKATPDRHWSALQAGGIPQSGPPIP